jgi:hypothetical protein
MAFTSVDIMPQRWRWFSYYESFGPNGKYTGVIAPGKPWRLAEIRLHLSMPFASIEYLTATISATIGSAHNLVMMSYLLSGSTDVFFHYSDPLNFLSDDLLTFILSITSGTNVVGLNVQTWQVSN